MRRGLPMAARLVLACLSLRLSGQQPAYKVYTSADGLGHDRVYRIISDKKGFLWFCTLDGLTRFDGQHFVNFGPRIGASFVTANDLLELPGGDYWIASREQGIIRFAAGGHLEPVTPATLKARFKPYKIGDDPSSNYVNALHLDRSGMVWIATRAGLYNLTENRGSVAIHPVALSLPGHADRQLQILSLTEDREGSIYAAVSFGVVRLLPDGRRVFYPVLGPDYDPNVGKVLFHDGVLWFGHRTGLFLLHPRPATQKGPAIQTDDAFSRAPELSMARVHPPATPGEAVFYRPASDPAKSYISAVHEFPDGRVWVAFLAGTFEYSQGRFQRILPRAPFNYVLEIGHDVAGNAWLATDFEGVARVESSPSVTLRQRDGIGLVPQGTLIDKLGEVLIQSWPRQLVIPDGDHWRTIDLRLASDAAFTEVRSVLQDRVGEWWAATTQGLYRFPKVAKPADLANVSPKAVFTRAEGLADDSVCFPFEDSRGDIWVGQFESPEPAISRWERRTGHIYRYSAQEGLPARGGNLIGIVEDFNHDLWFAFGEGGLARYRDGKFTSFLEPQGLTSSKIAGIVTDADQRVWCSIADAGLVRVEDASGPRLKLKTYSVTQPPRNYGLYGAPLFADAQRRIYVGLPHGVDRLDPSTGSVTHYGQADGVPSGPIGTIQADSTGAIWISSRKSVVHLLPDAARKAAPSPVLISGVRISGIDYQAPATGARNLSLNDLPYQMNSLQIDFLSLSFTAGQRPLFQYKLDGTNSAWSAPTADGTVNYGNLSPGDYRFQVRVAGLRDDSVGSPAQLTFRILPPFWRRASFIVSVLCAGIALLIAFERYRATKIAQLKSAMLALRAANEQRIAEIERVRRRIATDLHDDIGSSLTQISVLSEVARQQMEASSTLERPLAMIAGSSRELIDSMSDIVWAINPQRDHLSDLVHRVRRFAADMLTARNTQFTMDLPQSDDDMKLEGNLRREIFLIFKEALNNAVRHSGCTFVEIALRVGRDTLLLHLRDNGHGFDTSRVSDGHGLASMSSRASELGGRIRIASNPAEGSEITLEVPLKPT